MTSSTRFSYMRLRHETSDENDYEEEIQRAIDHVKARIQRSSRLQRVRVRKRLRMKIPSLRKFMRKRARLVMVSMAKVVKRLKDSQSHFGDLFAGNYLFMQVNPSPLKPSSPYAFHGSIKGIQHEIHASSPRVF